MHWITAGVLSSVIDNRVSANDDRWRRNQRNIFQKIYVKTFFHLNHLFWRRIAVLFWNLNMPRTTKSPCLPSQSGNYSPGLRIFRTMQGPNLRRSFWRSPLIYWRPPWFSNWPVTVFARPLQRSDEYSKTIAIYRLPFVLRTVQNRLYPTVLRQLSERESWH